MNYWLIKSEPGTWSWQDHLDAGPAEWDGVRNHQAKLNLQAMKKGDKAFFYHSGKDKAILGIVKVVRTYYPDPTDKTDTFGMVDFQVVRPLPQVVPLSRIREKEKLQHLMLLKNSRLSVQPVDKSAWQQVCAMGGLKM